MVLESTDNRFIEHLSYQEFVMTHKTHRLVRSERSKWDATDSWYGKTKDLQETEDFALRGWDAGLELIDVDDIKLNVHGNVMTLNSMAGGVVDIGGYVSGRPDHMLTFVDEVNRNKPELTIYVDIGYNGGFSADKIMKYTIDVMRRCNELQANYDVRIIAVCNLKGRIPSELYLDVKLLNEPFVINSIAFSFHPSFFRRLWHYYLNSREEIATGGGAMLRPIGVVRERIIAYHEKEYGSSAAIMFPSVQHHKGDLTTAGNYKAINFTEDLTKICKVK